MQSQAESFAVNAQWGQWSQTCISDPLLLVGLPARGFNACGCRKEYELSPLGYMTKSFHVLRSTEEDLGS